MKKILLIDDEDLVIKSIRRLLNKEGYEVVISRSGFLALDEVKKQKFSLIVCDIRMPKMTGVETIKEIRKILRAKGETPVNEILITGYAEDGTNQEAEALKVADYIYKPFDVNDFLACVRKHVGE